MICRIHNANFKDAAWVAFALTLASVCWAGRPLAIDDADPAAPGQIELEAGAAYEDVEDGKTWDFPCGVTYGIFPSVEVGFGIGWQLEEQVEFSNESNEQYPSRAHGIGDLTAGMKWQFWESCPLGARHAIAPAVKFPTADEEIGSGETDYALTWIVSRSLGDKAGLDLNLGHAWIGGPDDDVLHYGLALNYQLAVTVQWLGELFAERNVTGDSETIAQYRIGFRWSPQDNLTLDLAAGSKIRGAAPDFAATAGLTWSIDW